MSPQWRAAVGFVLVLAVLAAAVPARPASTLSPMAWEPAQALRAAVQPGSAGEVVLNDKDGLSPEEAAEVALVSNPRLVALRAQRGIAGAEVITAGLLPNPHLDSTLSFPVAGPEAHVLGYGVGISWNVTPLLSRGHRVRAAEAAATVVDLEVAWQEWQVAHAAELHAAQAIFLGRRLTAARDIEGTWSKRLSALRDALRAGAVTTLEATAAERSLTEARLARLDLEEELARARVDLNEAMGIDALAELNLESSWTGPRTVPGVAVLLASLPDRRLDLIATREATRSHDERLQAAVLARFPPIEVGVQTSREVDGVAGAGILLRFELPFFDRNQGNIARARADLTQGEAEYDARLAAARAQVVRLGRELERVNEKLNTAAEAEAVSARLAELARQAATHGGITPLVATDFQERAFAARLRHLELEQAFTELWIAIGTASGTEVR